MYGVSSFTAIINPPQACILAVGAAERVLSVDTASSKDDPEALPVTVMTLTLSCDHRVVDGALGAQFLQRVKTFLEDPAQMLL